MLMIMMKLVMLACLVLPCYTVAAKNTLPNLVMILQDDLGYYGAIIPSNYTLNVVLVHTNIATQQSCGCR